MILEDQEINDAAEAFQNLAGDGNLDQQSGLIEVDRSEPLHPVIRFRNDRMKQTGAAGADADDVSIELVEAEAGSKKLQIKDFDEPSEEELPGGTLLDLLGLPINSSADTSVSGSTAPAYSFLAKMTSVSSSSSGSSATSANSLEYVPRGGRVNTRPFALNGERLCNIVADGDDTDVEIVVPALAPVPESGITIQTVLDSEGYPVIMIGYSGGSGGSGSSWSGYHTTGSSADVIMCGLRYTDNQLQAKFCDEVWDNGLLVSRTFHNDWTVITTAVPESVCQCSSNANGTEQEESSQT